MGDITKQISNTKKPIRLAFIYQNLCDSFVCVLMTPYKGLDQFNSDETDSHSKQIHNKKAVRIRVSVSALIVMHMTLQCPKHE